LRLVETVLTVNVRSLLRLVEICIHYFMSSLTNEPQISTQWP